MSHPTTSFSSFYFGGWVKQYHLPLITSIADSFRHQNRMLTKRLLMHPSVAKCSVA